MEGSSLKQMADTLRQFTGFTETDYDFGAVITLTLACLDNLRANALEAELEEIAAYLSPEQADFLVLLAKYLQEEK